MNSRYLKYIFLLAVLVTISVLTGCRDEIEFEKPEATDGEVNLSGEIIFKPLVVADINPMSRTEAPLGSQFKTVNSLYILFFDANRKRLDEYSGEVQFRLSDVERPSDTNMGQTTAETITPRAEFSKLVRAGSYYIYAVANVDKSVLDDITSIEELRSVNLEWDAENMANNLAMFGVFKLSDANAGKVDNTGFENDELVALTRTNNSIHSWLRRASSKVTVAFDGSGLMDDVDVYIHSARLVDVAASSQLGYTIAANNITNAQSSFELNYGSGDNWSQWPSVSNKQNITSYKETEDGEEIDLHSEWARALPCYENKQGTREGTPKLQDSNGDGIIDNPDATVYKKDGVAKGTYLEVEGFYVSKHKNYKSQGSIKYRFMLGMNATNDFNVVRNHHYKVTMAFKGFGNEVDWHVEYTESVLDVPNPKEVNFQGKFHVPDYSYSNLGHNFSDQNTITVTSYTGEDDNAAFDEFEIYYREEGVGEFTKTAPTWIKETKLGDIVNNRTRDVTFVVTSDYKPVEIDGILQKQDTKGNDSKPYNLSNSTGDETIEETANCYIVDAPGVYTFPLVYGNAYSSSYKDGKNEAAYKNSAGPLTSFVSHLAGGYITEPFLMNNSTWCFPAKAELLWQDEQNLISNLEFDKDAFTIDGKAMGGIKFEVSKANIQQGNALIAVRDAQNNIMWSWHIWVTNLDFDKHSKITNNYGVFNFLNFNLGWCADKINEERQELRHYPRRTCEVKFVNAKKCEQTVNIVRHAHTVIPRGNNPGYQWGRKDPFPGRVVGNANKVLYDINNKVVRNASTDPDRIYEDNKVGQEYENLRQPTSNILNLLVSNPLKWHNPPRTKVSDGVFSSNNSTFTNLWSVGDGKILGVNYKTVYDPCPPGYQVCNGNMFYYFTSTGISSYDPTQWHDVGEVNMVQDFYGGKDQLSKHVIEFYTDATRLESIAIPLNGYRDWDARAEVYEYGSKGYLWTNTVFVDNSDWKVALNNSIYLEVSRYYEEGWDWTKKSGEGANEFTKMRKVSQASGFYNCDGCPVRPVLYRTM